MRNNNKNQKPVEVEETVVEPEAIEETVEEPVEVEEVIETEPEVEEPVIVPKMGVVTECFRLNVREAPSADAEIVATIDLATDVLIDESESTDDFYKITTATSIEGYCMKQFIAV